MTQFKVLSSDPKLLDTFLLPSLRESRAYQIDAPAVKVKLDQNETPFDWPEELKDKVLSKLRNEAWNRYPSPFSPELNNYLADYAGVAPENILTGPGTNYLITIFISALTRRAGGKVIIAQPSFPLYESHCRYEGVPYEVWPLTDGLQYDLSLFPETPDHSLIIFASPNNPTGSMLSGQQLESILTANPTSFVLADEAYFEFAPESYTSLLAKHANLIILRTCSKTLGAAGLRLGYALGGAELIAEIAKLRLPYLLNKFTLAAAEVFFTSAELQRRVGEHVELIVSERERVLRELASCAYDGLETFPTSANFFLVRLSNPASCASYYSGLVNHGILVRDVSRGPALEGCLRVTVGLSKENDRYLEATRNLLR